MRSKHPFQRFSAALACLMLCVLCMPQAAFAKGYSELPDEGKTCSISLGYGVNNKAVKGVVFNVYKVADMNKNVQLTLTTDFARVLPPYADANDLRNSLGATSWLKLAETLTNYCSPNMDCKSAATDAEGKVSFSGLDMGLYLVVGSRHADPDDPDMFYRPVPFLVALPSWIESEGRWDYAVDVTSKPQRSLTPGRVLKVWEDGAGRKVEHDPIQVQILKNGELYDSVTLRKENNWASNLDFELDNDAKWTFQEVNVPRNYTVNIGQRGITIVVTNTYDPPNDPGPGPGPDPDPDPDPGPDPDPDPELPPIEIDPPDVPLIDLPDPRDPEDPEPDEPIVIEDPDVPLADLPQTGQLWWPVPILAAAGVTMVLFGLMRRRSGANDEE